MKSYTVGTKVFCDFHFGGKPRGKVIEIVKPGTGRDTSGAVRVELTETVGAYRKGEILTVPTWQAVPVAQKIKLHAGQYFRRVSTDYQFA